MYAQRIGVLRSACRLIERNNKQYLENLAALDEAKLQLSRISSIIEKLKALDTTVAKTEQEWRKGILSYLEDSISDYLAIAFPEDGYQIALEAVVLRGKIHIETSIKSYAFELIEGSIRETQGCFFQEIVSFAALVSISRLLGIKTVYVDEAFSGASPENFIKLNKLLQRVKEQGVNLVLISQSNYFEGISGNFLHLQRSLDNQTIVRQVKINE